LTVLKQYRQGKKFWLWVRVWADFERILPELEFLEFGELVEGGGLIRAEKYIITIGNQESAIRQTVVRDIRSTSFFIFKGDCGERGEFAVLFSAGVP
jgi:hypothetical protein